VAFGKSELPKVYADFGSDIEFEMVPFVYERSGVLKCFDEASPCIEEQRAFCVQDVAKKADTDSQFPGQDKIVQWQICSAQRGSSALENCDEKVGLVKADVESCLSDSDRIGALIKTYLARSADVHGTPLEQVNGVKVSGDGASAIKKAVCAADSSVPACSSVVV